MLFSELGLSEPLQRAVSEQGYEIPTPIQAQAIPPILTGRDVLAAAQTGTGKTAGFTLPLLHRLNAHRPERGRPVRALVLVPTRELAAQVAQSMATYGKHVPLRGAVVFGGVGIQPQINRLRQGVDIVVATPGRLLDLYGQKAVNLSQVQILVLDEADRMLDMGFIHDIRRIIGLLPTDRQNLLFSATFGPEVFKLTQGLLRNPVRIEVAGRNVAAETVEQSAIAADKNDKPAALCRLLQNGSWNQALVFTRTKHGADRLTKRLVQEGLSATAIHGNKSQGARTAALAAFKKNQVRILVATDIAARGLDIQQLPLVVNFELPHVPEDYVHRIGRTGRAGAAGRAISLVGNDEWSLLRAIERLLKTTIEVEGGRPHPSTETVPHPFSRSSPRHRPAPQRQHKKGGSHPAARGGHKSAKPSGNRRNTSGGSAGPGGQSGHTPSASDRGRRKRKW